jgi:predicted RNase H-like HicB family nuclease
MPSGLLIDDTQVKQLFKAAIVEVLEERADLFHQVFLEAWEDIALARAIAAGLQTETVSSDRFFKSLPMVTAANVMRKVNRTMIYWKSDPFWLGKLLEHPEIMTQGETLEELEENLRDAYLMMVLAEVPEGYQTKEMML